MKNLKKITEVKECDWKQHKVNQELPPIGILNDIMGNHTIGVIIPLLSCGTSVDKTRV